MEKTCPHCGEEYEEGDLFCISCGANLTIIGINSASMEDFRRSLSSRLSGDKVQYYTELTAKLSEFDGIEGKVAEQKLRKERVQQQLESISKKLKQAKIKEAKERIEYDKLRKFTFTKMKAKLSGRYDEILEKEKEEFLNAVALAHETKEEFDELQGLYSQIESDFETLSMMQKTYFDLKKEHDNFINEIMEGVPHPEEDKLEDELASIREKGEPFRQDSQRLSAALTHLKKALRYLYQAEKKMGSAKTYSNLDTFFGGGMFVDIAKNSNHSDARRLVNQANLELSNAQKYAPEVREVRGVAIEGPSSFDMFFDNIFMDLNSRSKIQRGLENIRRTISQVRSLESAMRAQHQRVVNEYRRYYESYVSKSKELIALRTQIVKNFLQKDKSGGKAQ